MSAQATWPSKA
ncbi:unnamed protein product [Cuscuta epithymum]|nr:unnamed protein product [Cuscuta epithymum]